MTCAELYFLEYPGEIIKGRPQEYGYLLEKPKDCYTISCFKDCWAKEVQYLNQED